MARAGARTPATMDRVPDASCVCTNGRCSQYGVRDYAESVCCGPCVYGAALERHNRTRRGLGDKGVGIAGPLQCLTTASTVCGGDAFLLFVGAYLRWSTRPIRGADPLWVSCAAECCPLCSFAPCQMNRYRKNMADPTPPVGFLDREGLL